MRRAKKRAEVVVFKSRTILGHLAKGVFGFGLLAIVLLYAPVLGWWTVLPAIGALVLFRGCPMCWAMGLIETVLDRKSGSSCAGGSCMEVPSSPAPRPDRPAN